MDTPEEKFLEEKFLLVEVTRQHIRRGYPDSSFENPLCLALADALAHEWKRETKPMIIMGTAREMGEVEIDDPFKLVARCEGQGWILPNRAEIFLRVLRYGPSTHFISVETKNGRTRVPYANIVTEFHFRLRLDK